MPYQFFTIPIHDCDDEAQELNRFLNSHRIVTEKIELIHDGANSVWAVSVNYLDPDHRPAPMRGEKKSKVDYRELLSESDFQIYVKLRTLRKSLAEQQGVPPYALFTNQQLADLVEQRVTTVSAMQAIDGIGDARIKKYSERFLAVLCEAFNRTENSDSSGLDHET